MKRLLFTLLLLAPAAHAQLIQAPTGVKSTTAIVSQTVTVTVGQTVLIGDTFCDNSCAVSPLTDTLSMSGSQGDSCTALTSINIQNNEAGTWWQCVPATTGSDTITATVTTSASITHNAIQVSVWQNLPAAVEMAVGGNVTPGTNWTLLNAYNNSSVTAYGSGTPSFSAATQGGIVSYTFPAQPLTIVLPNCGPNGASGGTCTFSFPMTTPPTCTASAPCTIQVCDNSTPINCITLQSGGIVSIIQPGLATTVVQASSP